MKTYVKPNLEAVEVSLCDVILTSAPAPGFAIPAGKSAGTGTWLEEWSNLLS